MDNVTKQKNPILAAIGSFFVPGLGQVYNGEGILKGLLYLIGMVIGSIILVLPGLAIWIYGIYNAYKVAEKMNLGQIPYKETTALTLILYVVLVFVLYFVIVFAFLIFGFAIIALISSTPGTTY